MQLDRIIEGITEFILNTGFFPWLVIVFIIATYIFWAESKKVNKDRSSIFDQWIVSTIIMFVWGRISYIIANSYEFTLLQWFYSPYERYGDKVFWFRLLPWKFIAIWDGGFLFSGLIASFILFSFIYVTFFKKWSWTEMLRPVISASEFFLAAILVFYGIFIESDEVILFGFLLLAGVLLFFIFHLVIERFLKQTNSRESKIILYGNSIYVLISFVFIGFLFLQGEITLIDKINIGIIEVTGLAMIACYYIHSVSPNVKIESYSNVRPLQQNPSLTGRAIKVKPDNDE